MNKRIALGASLLALVWVMFMYGKVMPDETPSTPSTPDAPAPAAVTAVTRSEPSTVPRPTAKGVERTPDPSAQKAEPAPESPAVEPPPMPPSGHFEEMQRRFESESRDVAWSNQEETSIPPLLAAVGFPDDALEGEVQCRRTLCRIRLRVVENDALALMKLAGEVQPSGVGLAYGAAEVVGEKTRLVVYLSRRRAAL